jgi:ABC-type transport system involved in multi-copper enzyme maturation permease subunit
MKQLIWLSIISGYRSNSFRIIAVLAIICIFLAWLASGFSARSPETLLLDVGLSLQRAMLTLMAIFWVQELYYKDLEKKTAILLLAYPLTRGRYLCARFIGVSLLVFAAVILSAVLLYVASAFSGIAYQQVWPVNIGVPYVITWAYFFLDILVVVCFTFLLCSLSETANLPMLCGIAFSIAMHAMGPIVDYMRFAAGVEEVQKEWLLPVVEDFLYILPDLDRLDLRPWTLYNSMPDGDLMFWGCIIALAYSVVFLGLSIVSLNRREIS